MLIIVCGGVGVGVGVGGGGGLGGGTLILTYLYVCVKCLHCSVFNLECVFFIVSNLQWLLFSESYLILTVADNLD